MSRSTEVPTSNEHPDHDLLADLAAEVLPDDLAERVQAHVIGCQSCAALLAEAEGIRSLLRQLEPDPMPEEVLGRLERALVLARQEDEGTQAGQTGAIGVNRTGPIEVQPMGTRPPPTGSLPTGSINTGRRIARSRPSGASSEPATGLISVVGSEKSPASRLSRMSRPAQRARRQALEEQRADRPSRLGPLLKVAAAVLVVVGAGALTLQFTRGGSGGEFTSAGSANSASGGAAAEVKGAPVLAPVQSTNTNYNRNSLKSQINTLISSSQKFSASRDQQGTKRASDAATVAPRAAAASASPSGQLQGQQLLRSPSALQACLTAIGADQPPVAIDLARYDGQEAAIIVLPADGGGYEVWVVARDCRPDNDGSIAVVTLKQ
jgi:hypothetical protein